MPPGRELEARCSGPDLMMHDINGLEILGQVKKHAIKTHVLILSMYREEAYVMEALRAGAEG